MFVALLLLLLFVFFYQDKKATIIAISIFLSLLFLVRKLRNFIIGRRINHITIAEIDKMKGNHFEEYLKDLFLWKGYEVEKTKSSGDYGADLILLKGGKKIVVQAKRYHKPVGLKAVQEVVSSLKMYEAKEAWVVTNNYLTKYAIVLAKANNVMLIDRDKLIRIINQRERSRKLGRILELLKVLRKKDASG